jgi:leucyl aminopeptidase
MELILNTDSVSALASDVLVAVVFADGTTVPALPERPAAWLKEAVESGELDASKALESVLLHEPAGLAVKRLLVMSAGERGKFAPGDLRKLGGAALRALMTRGVKEIAFRLEGDLAAAAMLEALVEGVILGDFEPDAHKTEKKNGKHVERVRLGVPEESLTLVEALRRGRAVAEAQNFARTLVNEPGNLLTPARLAEHARLAAAEFGLECEILDEPRLRQLGMGALLGVAQGSAEPPCLVVLRYTPAEPPATADHLALVGKGVTFDSGGISIKPSDGMEKMKYDMAGAASVIGAMRALAQLKPRIRVTAFAPCVENMASHRSQRPGDIVTSFSGKTVEVLNTDAEGRLILADALTYAIRNGGATHLVDTATLTGAIVVALGHIHVGLFTNDDGLRDRVLAAARAEAEKMWAMPLDDDYKDYLKSAYADLPNIGGRWGGAVTAAKFLESFVENKPWVHLDIAGTAWLEESKPYMPKGPSGVTVRTMVRLAMDWPTGAPGTATQV